MTGCENNAINAKVATLATYNFVCS